MRGVMKGQGGGEAKRFVRRWRRMKEGEREGERRGISEREKAICCSVGIVI